MLRLIILILLTGVASSAQCTKWLYNPYTKKLDCASIGPFTRDPGTGAISPTVATDIVAMPATVLGPNTIGAGVGQLPAASASTGQLRRVTDALTPGSATGGGTAQSLLVSNGAAWIATSGTGSGGGAWGGITGTLCNQTDLCSALALKAPLANPTFTGTVTVNNPGTAPAWDFVGKTSGSKVTVTVADATAAGTLTIPGATGTIAYSASAGTSGHSVVYASDGIGLADGGLASTPAVVQLAAPVVVTGSSTTAITFSAISGAYSAIRIMLWGRCDAATTLTAVNISFNGDSGLHYYEQAVFGYNGSAGADAVSVGVGPPAIGGISCATSRANGPGTFDITIPGYSATVFSKTAVSSNSRFNDTLSKLLVGQYGVNWDSSAAITSVTLTVASGHYVAGTTAILYGML